MVDVIVWRDGEGELLGVGSWSGRHGEEEGEHGGRGEGGDGVSEKTVSSHGSEQRRPNSLWRRSSVVPGATRTVAQQQGGRRRDQVGGRCSWR